MIKLVALFHNPDAGIRTYSRHELVAMIEAQGFRCSYQSTKNKMMDPDPQTELVVVAGGDGTVGQVLRFLTGNELGKSLPVAILPLGTANNIASSLGIKEEPQVLVTCWQKADRRLFDLGKVIGSGKDRYFLESVGFGIFPELIKQMGQQTEPKFAGAHDKLTYSLHKLYGLVQSFTPRHISLELNGEQWEENLLMAEIMNIPLIGPNLRLAPGADPGGGCFEVVLIGEQEREKLLSAIEARLNGSFHPFDFKVIRSSSVHIQCREGKGHVDDELIQADTPLMMTIVPQAFELLV